MIVFNEEKNLPRTLQSIAWADEIVVVDSGSTDNTEVIARAAGARFSYHREFVGHGEQKNIAIDRCTGDWILLLDADEVVTPGLKVEIRDAVKAEEYAGYWIPRLNLFLHRWMRHGGLYPDRKLRLFRRNTTRLQEGVGPHATPICNGRIGALNSHLLHYAYPNFSAYIQHMNKYSSEIADARKMSYSNPNGAFLKAFVNPVADFIRNYLLLAGFLDGREGLLFHVNHALYVHWKYAKLWIESSEALHR